jgi:uncharacterized protein (DUF927 family)
MGIWTLPDRQTKWFHVADLEKAAEYAEDASNINKEVYFNICLRQSDLGPDQRGKLEDIIYCPGLWMDIDIKDSAHKKNDLPTTREEVDKIIETLPFQPTIKVNSGHGYHVYTLFDQPLLIEGEKQLSMAQNLLRDYQGILLGRAQRKGWQLDNTSDLPRVLRVPGTMNRKKEPVPVQVIGFYPRNRYPISEIRKAVDKVLEGESNQVEDESKGDRSIQIVTHPYPEDGKPRLVNITEECDFIRHCIDDSSTLPEPHWYAFVTVAARCQNGNEEVHRHSKSYPGYSFRETEKKIGQALEKTGPYTCEVIHTKMTSEFCEQCPYRGKIASPISLGDDSFHLMYGERAEAIIEETEREIRDNPMKAQESIHELLTSKRKFSALCTLYLENRPYFASFIGLANSYKQVKKGQLDQLEKAVREATSKAFREISLSGDTPIKVKDFCPDAPVSEELVMPQGWMIEDGLKRILQGKRPGSEQVKDVASEPIFITEVSKNIHEGLEDLALTFMRNGKWGKQVVPRADIFQAKRFLQYSGYGMPVHQNNVRDLIDYFAAFEKINLKNGIERYSSSSILGWQPGEGFLLGENHITAEEEKASKVVFAESQMNSGIEGMIKAIRKEGNYQEWLKAMTPLAHIPPALFCFYAAFVPPLMEFLEIPNYIIDIAYRTSSGKTTLQRVIASIYGKPDETNSIVMTWNSTRVFLERVSACLNGIPMILNDTKSAKDAETIENTVYDITNGTTRGRGTPSGVHRTYKISTVLFSSGEEPIVDGTKSAGVRTRVITLNVAPFLKQDDETAKIVKSLESTVRKNYGHAAETYIRYLVKNRKEKAPVWAKRLRELEIHYSSKTKSNAYVDRLSKYFASIDLAAEIAHEALELPWEFNSPIPMLWNDLTRETKEPTESARALEDIYSYCCTNRGSFKDGSQNSPPRTIGKWDSSNKDWQTIAIEKVEFEKAMKQSGYTNYKSILREWKESGFIETEGNRHTKRVTIDKNVSSCIVIKRKALEDLEISSAPESRKHIVKKGDNDDALAW